MFKVAGRTDNTLAYCLFRAKLQTLSLLCFEAPNPPPLKPYWHYMMMSLFGPTFLLDQQVIIEVNAVTAS